jgi:uncharacterized protein
MPLQYMVSGMAVAATHRWPDQTVDVAFNPVGQVVGQFEKVETTSALLVALWVLTGVASGVLAGLLGVGGGVLIVPVLAVGFGVPLVAAKGTSLVAIVPTAVMGTFRNARSGTTDLRVAAVVGLSGVASGFAASKVSLGLEAGLASILFAGLLALVAVRLGRTGLAERRAAAGPPAIPADDAEPR